MQEVVYMSERRSLTALKKAEQSFSLSVKDQQYHISRKGEMPDIPKDFSALLICYKYLTYQPISPQEIPHLQHLHLSSFPNKFFFRFQSRKYAFTLVRVWMRAK
jgi:hypothetical protein